MRTPVTRRAVVFTSLQRATEVRDACLVSSGSDSASHQGVMTHATMRNAYALTCANCVVRARGMAGVLGVETLIDPSEWREDEDL